MSSSFNIFTIIIIIIVDWIGFEFVRVNQPFSRLHLLCVCVCDVEMRMRPAQNSKNTLKKLT